VSRNFAKERLAELEQKIENGELVEKGGDGTVTVENAERYFLNLIKKQPTADVVEVVRCSNCKHSRPLNKMKSPEKYYKDNCIVCECEDVVGDEPMIYLGTHYCGYGERRDI
jgi:hypothetical protein